MVVRTSPGPERIWTSWREKCPCLLRPRVILNQPRRNSKKNRVFQSKYIQSALAIDIHEITCMHLVGLCMLVVGVAMFGLFA